MQMILSSLFTHWGSHQAALHIVRSHGDERVEGNCRKDKVHDLRYRPGLPAVNTHALSVIQE